MLLFLHAAAAPLFSITRGIHDYQFTVNGQRQAVDVDPTTPLLRVLRDHLGMTGTKFGCGKRVRGPQLAGYKIPRELGLREALPHNPTGKLREA